MTIEQLLERAVNLETRVKYMESELSITQTTSDSLKIMLHNKQQYSRRPCVVASGMEAPGDEVSHSEDAENVLFVLATESGIDKNIIANNINKVHPIGATLDNKQQRIVKFKTDGLKANIHGPEKKKKT